MTDTKNTEKKIVHDYDWGKQNKNVYLQDRETVKSTVKQTIQMKELKDRFKDMSWALIFYQMKAHPVIPIAITAAIGFSGASSYSVIKKHPAIVTKNLGTFSFVSKIFALLSMGYYFFESEE